MARTPTRTRKVLLAITLAMLAVVLVAWPISCWRQVYIAHVRSADSAPENSQVGDTPRARSALALGVGIRLGLLDLGGAFYHDTPGTGGLPPPSRLQDGWNAGAESYDVSNSFWNNFAESLRPDLELGRLTNFRVLGLHVSRSRGQADTSLSVSISHVLLLTVLGGLAFWLWWPQRLSARRRALGLCHRCGYDRKGLAPAAACPECGASAPASVADAQAPPTV